MHKADVKVGDLLALKEPMYGTLIEGKLTDAELKLGRFGSRRLVQPDMVGVVAAVDIPCVTSRRSFLCLDFKMGDRTYRTRPYYDQVRYVERSAC